jgi:thiamine biosynthesis lipoprotein ApbE
MTETLDPIWLQDKAVAAVSAQHRRFRFGDLSYPAFLDQRTGQPASGVQGALIATERALDAQALATTMMITGNREGQLRLAAVEPSPAALWLLGDDTGEPLINTYKWSVLSTQ